jgi:hypothetical protein
MVEAEGPMVLLREPAIRRELGLKPAQIALLARFEKDPSHRARKRILGEAGEKVAEGLQDLKSEDLAIDQFGRPPRLGGVDLEDMLVEKTLLRTAAARTLSSILTPGQLRRLEQIYLQAKGPLAVATDPDWAERLELDPLQSDRLAAIIRDSDLAAARLASTRVRRLAESLKSPAGAGGAVPNTAAIVESARKDQQKLEVNARESEFRTAREVFKVLSREQILVYRQTIGRPFDFSLLGDDGAPSETAR